MLYRTIRQICRFYSLPQQLKVYDSLLEESGTLRRHYHAYRALKPLGLGYLALAFYGFRTAGQHNVFARAHGDLAAFSAEPSQYKSIEYVCDLSGGAMKPYYVCRDESRVGRLKNMARLALDVFGKGGGRSLCRALRIIRRVERRKGWVQALNVASFLFNVFAFRHVFSAENKIGFTANDFSPAPLAFKYAGRKAGLKQMLTMHGQISAASSGNVFPRLDYDVAFLYGAAALEAYKAAGAPVGRAVLTGFPGESFPVRAVPEKIGRVGICLANYYDADTHEAICGIGALYKEASVIVRRHPRMRQRPDFSGTNISLSKHKTIKEFAQECDFVIAGNTGAQIDLLKLGCPVAHLSALDKLGKDDIGLVADGTAMLFEGRKLETAEIDRFFDREWVEKFRRYDALYLAEQRGIQAVQDAVRESYLSLLR